MKEHEIKFTDWSRWLMGDVPPAFLLESVLRGVIIFILLIVSMRLLGRRMAAQLSRTEMVALFSLAAAVGVPLLTPDRGLLPAFVIALVVVGVGRLVANRAFHSERFETLVQDELTILVREGVLLLPRMKKTRLSRQRLFSELRGQGIRHLGEVKRLYFEANGSFTFLRQEDPPPGLSVIPEDDTDFFNEQTHSHKKVCYHCGHSRPSPPPPSCPNCGKDRWVTAIL
ncbi:YetF domain-containing protein [Paraflavisolibacter sp. H34]|uniref:DUF421 domain-containing protein n=1 Tax=Huijunlia imazamoxiresistens TaxID=3127457 RepID=UPI003015FD6E